MSDADAGFAYRATFRFRAEPWLVFQSITQPETLSQWFAEHVDLQPRIGGHYRFWGKRTYGVPAPLDAKQEITHFDPPNHFAFSWTWLDSAGEAQFTLSEKDGGTELDLIHTFEHTPALPHRNPQEAGDIVQAFWVLAMSNLRHYLRHGVPAQLPDFTQVDDCVELSIVIQAPPNDVFQTLLDPAWLDHWMGAGGHVDPRVGGSFEYGKTDKKGGPGRILELEPGRLLVHDWSWADEPPTQVRWELEPCPEGTRVTLIHSGFAGDPAGHHYALGWSVHLLRLRRLVERGR